MNMYKNSPPYVQEFTVFWHTFPSPPIFFADIKGRQDVLDMGIDVYNEECRSIVMRYSKEWESVVTRIGRWIDFEVSTFDS